MRLPAHVSAVGLSALLAVGLILADLAVTRYTRATEAEQDALLRSLEPVKFELETERRGRRLIQVEGTRRKTELKATLDQERLMLLEEQTLLPDERRMLQGQLDILQTELTLDAGRSAIVILKKSTPTASAAITQESLAMFLSDRDQNPKWGRIKKIVVVGKKLNPTPNRPDWFYTEINEEVPPLNAPGRLMKGALGDRALFLERGLIVHSQATDPEGHGMVKHTCLQVEPRAMAALYHAAYVGTPLLFP